eukprot:590579-Rhodomonas_salina.1
MNAGGESSITMCRCFRLAAWCRRNPEYGCQNLPQRRQNCALARKPKNKRQQKRDCGRNLLRSTVTPHLCTPQYSPAKIKKASRAGLQGTKLQARSLAREGVGDSVARVCFVNHFRALKANFTSFKTQFSLHRY